MSHCTALVRLLHSTYLRKASWWSAWIPKQDDPLVSSHFHSFIWLVSRHPAGWDRRVSSLFRADRVPGTWVRVQVDVQNTSRLLSELEEKQLAQLHHPSPHWWRSHSICTLHLGPARVLSINQINSSPSCLCNCDHIFALPLKNCHIGTRLPQGHAAPCRMTSEKQTFTFCSCVRSASSAAPQLLPGPPPYQRGLESPR